MDKPSCDLAVALRIITMQSFYGATVAGLTAVGSGFGTTARADRRRDVGIPSTIQILYMKFLQGIPVVGAVGGAYDAVYMKRITEYAELKYRHRYLAGRKKAENGQLCKRCKSYRDI